MREFLKSPKKTAILGLVGSIIMIPTTMYAIGLTIYFLIILLRLYKQKGSIKLANGILIVLYSYQSVVGILEVIKVSEFLSHAKYLTGYFIVNIIYTIICILLTLYFINILFRKINLVNNKIFSLSIVVLSIMLILQYVFTNNFSIIRLLYLGYLLIIPYFYNYYELLKGEK